MQFRTKVVIIFTVTILFIIAAGYILVQSIEIVEEEVYTGLKGEARTNPYLAVERLLEKRGFSVHTIHDEYQLHRLCQQLELNEGAGTALNNKGTIFFLAKRDAFKQQTLEELLAWIESGGNLIMNVPPEIKWDMSGEKQTNNSSGGQKYTYTDFFTEYLEIEVYLIPHTDLNYEELETEADSIEVMLPGADRPLAVIMDDSVILRDTKNSALWAIQQDENNLLLQFKIGQGYISLAGSLSFMTNSMIGEKNNAALFWYVTTMDNRKGDVLFIKRYEYKSFWEILVQYTWMFLISLFILLVFLIWKSGMRFGPVISVTDTVRRSVIEHVYASGQFLWNRKHGTILLDALVLAVKYKIKTKVLNWDMLSAFDQLKLLKQRTELGEEVLNVLFISETREKLTKNSFLNKVKLLERIYEKV